MTGSTRTSRPSRIANPRRVSHLLVLLSLSVTLVLVHLIISQVDLPRTAEAWRAMSPGTLFGALLLVMLSNLARAGRLYCQFHSEMQGRFGRCLRVSLHHNFFNNLMPLRTGEAALPLLLRRHFDIELVRGTGALAGFRLLDLGVLLAIGLLALGLGFSLPEGRSLPSELILGLVILAVAVMAALRMATRRVPWLAERWSTFKSGLPQSVGGFSRLALWTLIIWSIKLTGYAVILNAFIPVPYAASLLAALSGELASGIPLHTPAAIGLFEGGVMAVLMPLGISSQAAVTAAVNLHLFLLAVSLLNAGFALFLGRGSR